MGGNPLAREISGGHFLSPKKGGNSLEMAAPALGHGIT
jgi:hypothetical protein